MITKEEIVISKSTRRAYESDIKIFTLWCKERDRTTIPIAPETVSEFILSESLNGVALSTINRRVAAIRYIHNVAGYEPPTNTELVKTTLKNIRRLNTKDPVQKSALTAARMDMVLKNIPGTLQGKRDRVLLSIGFLLALRRSELSTLRVIDLFSSDLKIKAFEAKKFTTPNGELTVSEMVRDWCTAAYITDGYLFRTLKKGDKVLTSNLSAHSISKIVKKYAGIAGFVEEKFSGHSLRSGYITSASKKGSSFLEIARVSGHKSMDALRDCIRI